MSEPFQSMRELSKKVCLLGDFAVGKTSLVRRFVYDLFDDKYLSTIGVKVSRKTVSVPAGGVLHLNMMLWDMSSEGGLERVRSSYLRGAAGALLVCDLTRPQTLDSLTVYAHELRAANAQTRLIVVGNKHDLVEKLSAEDTSGISTEHLKSVAGGLGVPWYLTSAKTGEAVEEIFRHLGQMLVS